MLSKPVVLLDLVADTTPPMSTGQTSKKGNLLAPFSCTPHEGQVQGSFFKTPVGAICEACILVFFMQASLRASQEQNGIW